MSACNELAHLRPTPAMAVDSTNNTDVRKFGIDLMPEINQHFTMVYLFHCSCRLGWHEDPDSPEPPIKRGIESTGASSVLQLLDLDPSKAKTVTTIKKIFLL